MAPSPSPRNGNGMRSPIGSWSSSRSHLNFPCRPHSVSPLPNVNANAAEHPVEVVGRIRNYPGGGATEKQKPIQVLQGQELSVRVRTDFGYRDFKLDGVSEAERDGLHAFYKKFVEARVDSVKVGGKCTVVMYGPTGSGKSHTMFGCSKEPGIVYRSLHSILGRNQSEETDRQNEKEKEVNVSVLEIYNEEIYDLLATNASKINGCRARLEVMGRKVKNAVFISGSNADKIANEVAKVEKRRVVKSTFCNERSSRSHCLITLDVPAVGGRLMLVDMAGSENIDQAGFAAKLQTAKINQGNVALKRVVEAIANGDPHVPFRDSRLTMLLQDSFEDNGTKILMVLCASPDPRDIHKTIGTLEYGAKAKCIVRCSSSPSKQKPGSQDIHSTVSGARIVAMDEYISKLQIDNKLKEKEREAAKKELLKKEEEVAKLRAKLQEMQEKQSEKQEEIELKVEEKARLLKLELLRIFEECQKSANVFVELGKRKVEEKILQQQEEVEMLRQRLEEIEFDLEHIKSTPFSNNLVRMDASMEIERISDIGEAGELVASSARVLEGMQLYIQQTKDKFMSPQDKVQKLPYCTVSEGGIHMNGHAKVISSDKMRLNSLDFSAESISNEPEDMRGNPKFDSKGEYGDNVTIVDELASLSDHVNNSFNTLNKDERFLIHQQFPFLKLNSTDSYDSGHSGDGLEEDHTESTRFMKKGWLPTVYEEEEGDIRDGDSSAKGATSSNGNCIISDFVKTQIADGCCAEGEILDHFEPKMQQVSYLQNSTKLALDKQADKDKEAEKGESENWAGRLGKPAVIDAQTNLDYGNVQTRLLWGSEHQIDPTVSRKERIQNIFLLCGNYRELAEQARNAPPNKGKPVNGERSDPVDIPRDETPKEARVGSSGNSTTSFEEPVHSLNPEVAGLVTPSRKILSPQDAKLISWSPSPEKITRHELRSPWMFITGEVELGVPISKFLTLNYPSRAALTEVTSFQQVDQIKQEIQSKDNDETQVEEDDNCDVYVKWETSKEDSEKLFQIFKMSKSANLIDLRKMIEPHLGKKKQDFIFLMLQDPDGAPVSREKEASIQVTSLPDCQNQCTSRLACLRLPIQRQRHHQETPLNSLQNKLSGLSCTTSSSSIKASSCSSAVSKHMSNSPASLLKELRL